MQVNYSILYKYVRALPNILSLLFGAMLGLLSIYFLLPVNLNYLITFFLVPILSLTLGLLTGRYLGIIISEVVKCIINISENIDNDRK